MPNKPQPPLNPGTGQSAGPDDLSPIFPMGLIQQKGVKNITTETGGGQWGTALASARSQFDVNCEVYMVRISYDQKPYRKVMMNTFGAEVYPSPSDRTQAGRNILTEDP